MNYVFAIDETGIFDILSKKDKNNESFVCGILVSKDNEQKLKDAYEQAYKKGNFGNRNMVKMPIDFVCQQKCSRWKNTMVKHRGKPCSGLREGENICGGGKDCLQGCKPPFHYAHLSDTQKKVCKEILFPFANDKIFVSTGKTLLRLPSATAQDYWLKSVLVVIDGLFNSNNVVFNDGDSVEIEFDERALTAALSTKEIKNLMLSQMENLVWRLKNEGSIDYLVRYWEKHFGKQLDHKSLSFVRDILKSKNSWYNKREKLKIYLSNQVPYSKKQDRYQEYLAEEINEYVNSGFFRKPNITISVTHKSDTKSYFVNLADIACGFVNYIKKSDKEKYDEIVNECHLEKFVGLEDPETIIDTDPARAVNIILAQALNGNYENVDLIKNAFENAIADENSGKYPLLWDTFYNFLEYNIKSSSHATSKLFDVVNCFRDELKYRESSELSKNIDKKVEYVRKLGEFYSHAGEVNSPISESEFILMLEKENVATIRKWEYYINYHNRHVQFKFNSYDFSESIGEHYAKIVEQHTKIIDAVKDAANVVVANFDISTKEKRYAEITSTLGQYYAYVGNTKKADEWLNVSLDNAPDGGHKARIYSYLLAVEILKPKPNLENARKYFAEQVRSLGVETLGRYFNNQDVLSGSEEELNKFTIELFNNDHKDIKWALLSYAKLRALEIYINGETILPEVIVGEKENDRDYPWPLTLKWAAVAMMLKPSGNIYNEPPNILKRAADNSMSKKDRAIEFTVETLALPVLKLRALIEKEFDAELYRKHLSKMKENKKFCQYVENDNRAKPLNDGDVADDFVNWCGERDTQEWRDEVWKRATALPFLYS